VADRRYLRLSVCRFYRISVRVSEGCEAEAGADSLWTQLDVEEGRHEPALSLVRIAHQPANLLQ
jgi:hypothetical protein